MQMLNRYFTPFALILILSAIYYSEPEPQDAKMSLGILGLSILVNWWLAAHAYRYIRWAGLMKSLQVIMNFLWSVPLVYLLVPYWAPMWLLFVMPPVTAALTLSRAATTVSAGTCAATLLAVYSLRNPLEGPALGMACVHAAFIVIFALFVHALAQTALRLLSAR